MTNMNDVKKAMVLGKMTDNPTVILKDMILSIEALKGLYRLENKALDEANVQEFLNLQEKKMEIARSYQEKHDFIVSNKEEASKIDEAIKVKMEDLKAEFSELTKTNLEKLNRMKRITERLYGRVMEVAKKDIESRNAKYSSNGILQKRAGQISVGIHETA